MPFNVPCRLTRMRLYPAADSLRIFLVPFLLAIIFSCLLPLAAQTSGKPDEAAALNAAQAGTRSSDAPAATGVAGQAVPARAVLGFCRFDTTGLDPGLEYLGQALPEAWAGRLNQPLFRKPDLQSAVKSRRKAWVQEVLAGEKKLSDALESRDRTWLKGSPPAATRRSLDSQIQSARTELGKITERGPRLDAEVEANLPAWQVVDRTKLVPDSILAAVDATAGPALRAKDAGVDLLVWGRFHDIGKVLFLEIHLYDAALDMELFTEDWPLDDKDYPGSGLALLDRLMPAVLGFDAAGLVVTPESPGARVSLKSSIGLDYGTDIGKRTWNWLLPGSYVVQVLNDASFPTVKILELKPGEVLQVAIATVAREKKLVRIESQPSGARVHDGVVYLGSTPFDLDTGSSGGLLVLKMEGYEDLMVPVPELLASAKPLVLQVQESASIDSAEAAVSAGETPGAAGEVQGAAESAKPDDVAGTGLPADVAVPAAAALPDLSWFGQLKPEVLNWKSELETRRNAFYNSLGLFALSLGPAIVFNALTENIRARLPTGSWSSGSGISMDEYNRLVSEGNLYYYMGLGGIFLSAVMFTDAGIKLSEYLGVADAADGK